MRYATSTIRGMAQKMTNEVSKEEVLLDDATLAHKVETELFRDPDVPKGKININAEDGVVVLRGQVPHPEDIDKIEQKVRHIPGVHGVENLLHLPHTPPPMS
jgi:osmotically-inducible protein OsmY